MNKWRVIIIGAAGRDFHNFNTVYKDDKNTEVVAFTAAQIPGIGGRKYPPTLAGKLYPKGIPIVDEKNLERIITEKKIDECALSYSDLSYEQVMRLASCILAAGAKFSILSDKQTALKSAKPIIAVLAVRTGCGKSQTTRRVVEILREAGKKTVVVRHPMPYGDLNKQNVQRYATIADLKKHNCTIEEMEEYEPHLERGSVVYAGVDYKKILKAAEKEADVIVWDGGNNDTSFFRPSLRIVVADPLRAGHEIKYFPGEVNFLLADIVLINKVNSAKAADVETVVRNAKIYNPSAKIIKAKSILQVQNPEIIKGKRVLVIEDGPTVTHGEMGFGAGTVAARRTGAKKIVDPRPYAVGGIKKAFEKYPHIGNILPALGYGKLQMRELEKTINRVNCDSVVVATPINLARFIRIRKPHTRVSYDLSSDAKEKLRKIFKSRGLI